MNDKWWLLRLATVVVVVIFLSACWGGHTRRFVLSLDGIPLSGELRQINVASVERDPDGIKLINVGVKPWGKFDDDDQANLAASLKDTLKAATQGRSATTEGTINVHLVIRKYIVGISNNSAAVWAGLDWCAADADNTVLFQETFYATSTGRLVVTTGGVKDDVNLAIVKRLAQTTVRIAANLPPAAVMVPDTHSVFEAAAATMPETLRSWGMVVFAPVHTTPVYIPGTAPERFPLELAAIKEPIDWQKRLAGTR